MLPTPKVFLTLFNKSKSFLLSPISKEIEITKPKGLETSLVIITTKDASASVNPTTNQGFKCVKSFFSFMSLLIQF